MAWIIASWLIAVNLAAGQSAPEPRSFEVASVKPNKSGRGPGSTSRSGEHLILDNVSLRECIGLAYGIGTDQDYALSGPAWLGVEKYNIAAKVSPDTPRDEVLLMLQALLAERFRLQVHRETRESSVYLLTLARGGAKLGPPSEGDGSFTFRSGHISARALSMKELANRLSGSLFKLGRPVIDSTGLNGSFAFTLDWSPDGVQADDKLQPSIFTALQEQLGLKLAASRRRIEILVVDHAEKIPSEN